ncbi:MAG: metalloprotease [Thermoplasmatota archaeon]
MPQRSAYNPFYVPEPAPHAGRPRITFSWREALHIGGAILILTACLAIVLKDGFGNPFTLKGSLADSLPSASTFLASLLAIGSGFVLHELAHKLVAQRYGHWAEFRAQFSGLLVSLLIALGIGFLAAAPGAVVIQGSVTRRENGIISLVGPGTNLLIGVLAFPFTQAVDPHQPFPDAMRLVATANGGLCLLNLLPFGQLDGRKVLRWSGLAYGIALALCLAFLALLFVRGVV